MSTDVSAHPPWPSSVADAAFDWTGAFLPLVPFLTGFSAPVPVAAIIALIALFAVGAAMSLFSGRNALWGGARMLLIGAAAGAATFGIGSLFGVATS